MKAYNMIRGFVAVVGLGISMGGCPGVSGDLSDLDSLGLSEMGPLGVVDINAETNITNNITNNYYGEHEIDPRLTSEFSLKSESSLIPVVADAGRDFEQFDWEGVIRLDGSASEGVELTYSWVQIGGPANLVFDSSRVMSPTLSMQGDDRLLAGTYEFELMVSDGENHDGALVAVTVIQVDPEYSASCHLAQHGWGEVFDDNISNETKWESYYDGSGELIISSNCPRTFQSRGEVGLDYYQGVFPQFSQPESWEVDGMFYYRLEAGAPDEPNEGQWGEWWMGDHTGQPLIKIVFYPEDL